MTDERVTFDLSQAEGTHQSQSGRPRSRNKSQPRGEGNTTPRGDRKDRDHQLDYSYTEREASVAGETLLAKSRELIVNLREELVRAKQLNHVLEHKHGELIEEAQQAVREKLKLTQQLEQTQTALSQREKSLKQYNGLCREYSEKIHHLKQELVFLQQKVQELTFGTQALQVDLSLRDRMPWMRRNRLSGSISRNNKGSRRRCKIYLDSTRRSTKSSRVRRLRW